MNVSERPLVDDRIHQSGLELEPNPLSVGKQASTFGRIYQKSTVQTVASRLQPSLPRLDDQDGTRGEAVSAAHYRHVAGAQHNVKFTFLRYTDEGLGKLTIFRSGLSWLALVGWLWGLLLDSADGTDLGSLAGVIAEDSTRRELGAWDSMIDPVH